MITKADIAALWLEACPSFGPAFNESCTENGVELLNVHAGAFARHILSLHRSQQRAEFHAIACFIERLHTDGDPYTREFATTGILEGIQNIWGHSDIPAEEFLPYLLPDSTAAWHSLKQFWAGEMPPRQQLRGTLRGMDTDIEREEDRL